MSSSRRHSANTQAIGVPLALASAALLLRVMRGLDNGALERYDAAARRAAQRSNVPGADGASNALQVAAKWPVTTTASLGLAALALARGWRREAAFLAASGCGAPLFDVALKFAFERPKPSGSSTESDDGSKSSFPSGHVMAATGLVAGALVTAGELGAPAPAVAAGWAAAVAALAAVAASRLYLDEHYLSDVVAGELAAAAWVSAVAALLFPEGARKHPDRDG